MQPDAPVCPPLGLSGDQGHTSGLGSTWGLRVTREGGKRGQQGPESKHMAY